MIKFFFSEAGGSMRFSEWLKLHRNAAKLSQDLLADKITALGFKRSGAQISNYEREYDKDNDGNPTRAPEKFVEFAALVLNRPLEEARKAAGYYVDHSGIIASLENTIKGLHPEDYTEFFLFAEFLKHRRKNMSNDEKITYRELAPNIQPKMETNNAVIIGTPVFPELAEVKPKKKRAG